jgi:hypothetical protein
LHLFLISYHHNIVLSCADKYHGVVLIPEGLVESIPELYALLQVSITVSVPETAVLFTDNFTEMTLFF